MKEVSSHVLNGMADDSRAFLKSSGKRIKPASHTDRLEQDGNGLVDLTQLFELFPKIKYGDDFYKRIRKITRNMKSFELAAIQTDPPSSDSREKTDTDHSILIDIASSLDRTCAPEGLEWGMIDFEIFGICFPEKYESPKKVMDDIRNFFGEKTCLTVSVGFAKYPFLDYKKENILENAKKALEHARFLAPSGTADFDAVSLNISGDNLFQKGDTHAAIHEFETALKLDPENVNVHNSLGVCYGKTGENEKALAAFEKAISIDPADAMALYNAGLVRMTTGNEEKALDYFMKVDQAEDGGVEAALQIGRILMKKGRLKKARTYFEKVAKAKPEWGAAHRLLGDCLSAMKENSAAIKAYRTAVKKQPGDAASLSALGRLFRKEGENLEIAAIFCRHSVDIEPENAEYRYRLGRIYLDDGRIKEALEEFRKAAALGYDSSEYITLTKAKLEKIHEK